MPFSSTLCVSEQDEGAVLTDAFDRASVEQYCTVADIIEAVDDIPTAETSHEFYELCFAAAYEECVDHSAVSFRPGAEDALAAASETNVGLVTNGDEATQTVKLDALGIADAFDTLVFVDPRNGVPPKPDAAPFEKALTDLGVAPDDALHVGDSLRADVAGANALGIDSVWVPHENRRIESAHEPTHTLTSLAEFPELL
ncbi:HAD family hydrolase [Haladaptatus sp. W1]|uniref:HAD family hydrolase n=1 Tax=Haladaptatus sp. W1 TaxID=1897478 RepID=UPI000B01B7CB|nr:HAD family hydrolase [Haladaptatus sp. W1]